MLAFLKNLAAAANKTARRKIFASSESFSTFQNENTSSGDDEVIFALMRFEYGPKVFVDAVNDEIGD